MQTGLKGEATVKVFRGNTAVAVGCGSVPVFATPMLIALMENAAINALREELSPEQTTVGTKVDVVHLAATPIGMNVTARAELVQVDGRRLLFEITAEDETELVGRCRHERFVVERERFLARVGQKQAQWGNR